MAAAPTTSTSGAPTTSTRPTTTIGTTVSPFAALTVPDLQNPRIIKTVSEPPHVNAQGLNYLLDNLNVRSNYLPLFYHKYYKSNTFFNTFYNFLPLSFPQISPPQQISHYIL